MTDATIFMSMRFLLAAMLFVPFLKPQEKHITKAGLEIGAWYAAGYVAQVRTGQATRAHGTNESTHLSPGCHPTIGRPS
jgi:hypothetical protein